MSPILLLVLSACGPATSQLELYDGPSNGRIGGLALDDDGERLSEVQVELSNGMLTTTDADGLYSFSGVQPDDYVLTYHLDGFTRVYRNASIEGWERVSVNATLYPVGATFDFDTTDGGTFQHDNTRLVIPAGDLVDSMGNAYAGPVTLQLTGFDPRDFSSGAIPGPDDYRAERNGNQGTLVTQGFFEATLLSPSGEELNLSPGAPAAVEIETADVEVTRQLDLWWFDPDAGLWVDEGSFDRTVNADGTDVLSAEIPHFSWWNADWYWKWSLTCVDGVLKDTTGNPVVGATVTISADRIWNDIDGRYYDASYSLTTTTDFDGYWELSPVNSNNPYHTLSFSYTTASGELIETSEPYTTGDAAIEVAWDRDDNVAIDPEYCENVVTEIEVCALGAEYRVIATDSSGTKIVETEEGDGDGQFTAMGAATAWYFDPGNADECSAPIVEVEMGSCVDLGISDTPLDVVPDLSNIVGLTAGDQVQISNSLFTFNLDQRTQSDQPYYISYALDEAPVTGTSYDVTVPGAGDGFPGYVQTGALNVPESIELQEFESGSSIVRSLGASISYNGMGAEDGVHVLVQRGTDSFICRQEDNGLLMVPASAWTTSTPAPPSSRSGVATSPCTRPPVGRPGARSERSALT